MAVGTEGHLLGGALAVVLLGPWLGPVVITVVTVVQALFLGDGGLSTLGVNVVNLALVPAAVGYPVLLGLRRLLPRSLWVRRWPAESPLGCRYSLRRCCSPRSTRWVVLLGYRCALSRSRLWGFMQWWRSWKGLVTALVVRALLALANPSR